MKIVVTGPESSGTRLMTRILKGTGAVEVMHRSMPTGPQVYEDGEYIDSGGWHWPTDRDWEGFEPDWLVIMERQLEYTVKSQLKAGHVKTTPEACRNIAEAWRRLAEWRAAKGVKHVLVSYELLVEQPERTIEVLCQTLGLPVPAQVEEIFDANRKYRQQVP